ncbi:MULTISPECIES: FAD-binding oxidoreductase [Nocardioides]|uniref:FAD-binding oxidoreductase n=1 Tax=Nocardioides TaxID=1839 RepID=UPI00032FACC2|nr:MULTISPECIES: FAD-binding oxidoreductase [Nocardioides]EON22595.1 FAD linked oxidase domain-containing protein [Nocardioides sp. CF8]
MSTSIDALREQVRAQIITADDSAYDDARAVHNGMFDRKPLAILRAEQVADVVAGVNYARDAGVELAVRGGGHSAPGFGSTDGGLVIDLSGMRGVHVDPRALTARAGGGATWGDYNYATHAYGLASTGGIVSTTGVGGLTLNGGIGYLTRGQGLSIDCLASAEVVTADGQVRTASAEENPDLFWAIRGGGGNFGVVTSFEFNVQPVKDAYVGLFFYELEHAGDLLRFFRDWIQDAPREYGAFPAFQVAPPLPFVPEDRHGDTFCVAVVHWTGPMDEGEKAMQPFRDLAPRVAEMCDVWPYPQLNGAFDGLFPKGIRSYWKGAYVMELTDEAIEAHLAHGPHAPDASSTMHLYPINGAAHDPSPSDTAFAYRSATYAAVILSAWQDPALDVERRQWVRDYYDAISPHSERGGYLGFMAEDDADKVEDNFAGNYPRLTEVKRAYDPDNLFRLNQNIVP